MNPQSDDVSEPWESLDVSDSDIPSLRPCSTRRRSPQPSSPAPQIPGPAGTLQAAMHHRAQQRSLSSGCDKDPVPTQEFIRSVFEDGDDRGSDSDFAANPWLCAQESFGIRGGDGNRALPSTPLSSIKNGIHGDRVALVVAIIKSCTHTGLGDLMVILKDPSGTLGASIHHKVLMEGDNGKNISAGAVLVLQKVAVFAPSRSAYYLNVTLSNVVKIISKDCGPPSEQNSSPSSVRYALQGSKNVTHIPQARVSQLETQEVMNNLRKSSESSGSVYRVSEKTMEFPGIESNSHGDRVNEVIRAIDTTPNSKPEMSFGTKKQKVMAVSRIPIPDWTNEQLEMLGVFDD